MDDLSTFGREADRIAEAVRHWSPARWRVDATSGGGSRADVMAGAVQRIADLAADAEGQPRRRVPPPNNPVAWTDRWRVVVADLVASGPSADDVDAARDQVRRLRDGLW